MQWLNLHHLRYFQLIAETGTISDASKLALVGQSALSSQLKQFEAWLGFNLFDRVGKSLVLTPQGEYVLKYAKAINRLEGELLANIHHALDQIGRELVLGAQESVPKSILAETLCKINKSPPLQLRVIEGTGQELFDLMVAGKVDAFIGNFRPLSAGKEVFYVSLGKEKVSVWGAPAKKHLKTGFPKSLDGEKFILPGFQNPLRHDFEKYMLQHGLSFSASIEAQDTALQKELAARGEGLLVLGDESVKAWAKASSLVRLGTIPGLTEEYWFGVAKRSIDNVLQKQLLKSLNP